MSSHTLPRSSHFDDIYGQSLLEKKTVFIDSQNLSERFCPTQPFCVGETGFGLGLNFLLTCKAWEESPLKPQHLYFISTEKYPLSHSALKTILDPFVELEPFRTKLLNQYPFLTPGTHLLAIDPKITLILLIGDAQDLLATQDMSIDAWYFDGFSPSQNPDLWSLELFTQVAHLSKQGSTFSTYTSAGFVRRNLEAVGFKTQKVPGFGKKRERLIGSFQAAPLSSHLPIWMSRPHPHTPKKIAIIGAGLAGCATAYRLTQAGFHVHLIESSPEIAMGASGNPAGILMPTLSPDHHLADQFYTQGFELMRDFILQSRLLHPDQDYNLSGLTQAARIPRLLHWAKSLKSRAFPENLVCITEPQDSPETFSVNYPTSGWIKPQRLCQAFLDQADGRYLTLHLHTKLQKFTDQENKKANQNLWCLITSEGMLEDFDAIILTPGFNAQQFPETQAYPLWGSGGQITTLTTPKPHQIDHPYIDQNYLIPLNSHQLLLGATYRHSENKQMIQDSKNHNPEALMLEVLESDHQKNISGLAKFLADKNLTPTEQTQISGRTAHRPTTPDHLPLIGPVADHALFLKTYAQLAKGGPAWRAPPAEYLPGLYLNSGYGSKGLSACLLSAYLIEALLTQGPLPLSKRVYEAVHPSRFWFREMAKTSSRL